MHGNQVSLVCFAVKEESRFFRPPIQASPRVQVCLTGIGPENARRAVLSALEHFPPTLVLTCGFAGGLNPRMKHGVLLFDADPSAGVDCVLGGLGAVPAVFHTSRQIAGTVGEKAALRNQTAADAVEMESGAVRQICRERNIPSATIRVVLDSAADNLPLDFNGLMTAQQRLNYVKLIVLLAKSPGRIVSLIRLRAQAARAAKTLGSALNELLNVSEIH